jgi:hypothetical protein
LFICKRINGLHDSGSKWPLGSERPFAV